MARVINLLGATLPLTLLPAPESNDSGHWESEPLVRLNDEILAAVSLRWDDPAAFPVSWWNSPNAGALRARLVETIAGEYGDAPCIVLKDPRVCRLLGVWIPAF